MNLPGNHKRRTAYTSDPVIPTRVPTACPVPIGRGAFLLGRRGGISYILGLF